MFEKISETISKIFDFMIMNPPNVLNYDISDTMHFFNSALLSPNSFDFSLFFYIFFFFFFVGGTGFLLEKFFKINIEKYFSFKVLFYSFCVYFLVLGIQVNLLENLSGLTKNVVLYLTFLLEILKFGIIYLVFINTKEEYKKVKNSTVSLNKYILSITFVGTAIFHFLNYLALHIVPYWELANPNYQLHGILSSSGMILILVTFFFQYEFLSALLFSNSVSKSLDNLEKGFEKNYHLIVGIFAINFFLRWFLIEFNVILKQFFLFLSIPVFILIYYFHVRSLFIEEE